jgi:hypothetical protein
MLKKNIVRGMLLLLLLQCVIAVSPLYAANVSFLVIESGQPRGNSPGPVWENNLLDVFFDLGHIVSNSPILHIPHKPDDGFPYEAERDYEFAQSGGMEYFIVAVINNATPYNVSLRMFRTNSRDLLAEHTYTHRTYRSSREETEALKNAIRGFAAELR